MSALVVDASVTLTWLFEDQKTRYTLAVLEAIASGIAVVPGIWALEVANVVALSERKGIISAGQRAQFLALIESLPAQVEHYHPRDVWREVLATALKHRLTTYDAAYLELARRLGIPLASLDTDLVAAAKRESVAMFSTKQS
jgi:predicted nucleic acid-binding protein